MEEMTPGSNYFCVSKILIHSGKEVLYVIFTWGCEKPNDKTLREYLLSKGMSNKTFKSFFNGSQRDRIEADPTGKSFDITLLYNSIQTSCSHIAPPADPVWMTPGHSLEYLLYRIKSERNNLVHEIRELNRQETLNKIEEIRSMLSDALQKAGYMFNRDQQEVETVEKNIHKMINKIRDESLTVPNAKQYLTSLTAQRESLRTLIISNGKKELKEKYSSHNQVDSFSFIWPENRPEITSVFTKFELMEENAKRTAEEISIEDLLMQKKNGEIPQIIIIEGVAGSGKTTFTSYLTAAWISDNVSIKKLEQYELLFNIECRNQHISSLPEFFSVVLQKTSKQVKDDDLIQLVSMSKVLFLIDGLDEMNDASYKLVHELLQKHLTQETKVICTTRPQSLGKLYRMCPDRTSIYHLKIIGIPTTKQPEFIRKYHEHFLHIGRSRQSTEHLLAFWKSKSQLAEHFRLPLNLAILVYLYISSPEIVSKMTSSTMLYQGILKLSLLKLTKRLGDHLPNMEDIEIQEKCENFLEVLYNESLVALCRDSILLNKEGIDVLKVKCDSLMLPSLDVISSFLTYSRTWTGKEYTYEFLYPHKGLQDFYAALSILTSISKEGDEELISTMRNEMEKILTMHNIPSFISSELLSHIKNTLSGHLSKPKSVKPILEELHGEDLSALDISKYQNVLVHLVGLLVDKGQNTLQKHASELVDLLHESGIKNFEQWLSILNDSEYDPVMLNKVAKVIPTSRWLIRDSQVKGAFILLKSVPVKQIELHIETDPNKISELKDLLQLLASTNCELYLSLNYHWQNPEQDSSQEILECLKDSKLKKFMGSVKDLSQLTIHKNLMQLYIAFGSSYALMPMNSGDELKNFKDLHNLYINILAGVPAENLPTIPNTRYPIDLWLSKVDDTHINWVTQVATKFKQINSMVWSVRFPKSNLTKRGCIELNSALKGIKIGRDGIWVSSPHITEEVETKLQPLFLQLLKINFKRVDDERIWAF